MRDRPAIIGPPPLLGVIAIAAGLLVNRSWPLALVPGAGTYRFALAALAFLVGAALLVASRQELVKHREHPNPYRPTNAIVTDGVYRFTRNPIYVGFLLIVVAIAIAANTAWVLVSAVVLFVALHFGVVRAEEKYLSAKFGDSYANYCRRVRRWI